jgi:hypothetical protein
MPGKDNVVTYNENFLADIKANKYDKQFAKDWPKLEQAAQVHGYRGASKKKHNGIVPIRPSDSGLFKTLEKLSKEKNWINKQNQLPIKVVAHCESGNRLVGYRYLDGLDNIQKIHILGLANYAN